LETEGRANPGGEGWVLGKEGGGGRKGGCGGGRRRMTEVWRGIGAGEEGA